MQWPPTKPETKASLKPRLSTSFLRVHGRQNSSFFSFSCGLTDLSPLSGKLAPALARVLSTSHSPHSAARAVLAAESLSSGAACRVLSAAERVSSTWAESQSTTTARSERHVDMMASAAAAASDVVSSSSSLSRSSAASTPPMKSRSISPSASPSPPSSSRALSSVRPGPSGDALSATSLPCSLAAAASTRIGSVDTSSCNKSTPTSTFGCAGCLHASPPSDSPHPSPLDSSQTLVALASLASLAASPRSRLSA
mmetsp:Transcript_35221/g.67764  ORF Transcript_35221/g.67764 Transcript_35221/m.67764 type:complete len:254 (+) Transcript_35221:1187-1948(+)